MKHNRIFKALIVIILAVAVWVISVGLAGSSSAEEISEGDTCGPYEVITVIHHDAVPAVYKEVKIEEDTWQRYSWTGGPHESDTAPAFPSDNWQPNVKGDPHGIGVEGAYFRSNGNSGKGDWFYLQLKPGKIELQLVTPAKDAYDELIITDFEGTPCPETEEPPVVVDPPVTTPEAPVSVPEIVEVPVVVTATPVAAEPVIPVAAPAPVRVLAPSFTG